VSRPGRRLLVRALACALLFGLDAALARLAVATNAAGALLSPGGASPGALMVAAAFFANRLTLSLAVCVGAALAASDLVRWGWPRGARRAPVSERLRRAPPMRRS
jgi:hypothetical protein